MWLRWLRLLCFRFGRWGRLIAVAAQEYSFSHGIVVPWGAKPGWSNCARNNFKVGCSECGISIMPLPSFPGDLHFEFTNPDIGRWHVLQNTS
jgi:hypothetical protein